MSPELRPSVECGAKTSDIRIETPKNGWLIREMRQYQPNDALQIQFGIHARVFRTLDARVIAPTKSTPFSLISDAVVERIVGLWGLKKPSLLAVLQQLYGKEVTVDEDTVVHLSSFEKIAK
jgi:hypothetical protein